MEEDNQLTTEQLLLLENLTYLVDNDPMITLVSIKEEYSEKEDITVKDLIDKIDTEDLNLSCEYGSYMTGEDWVNLLQAIEKDDTLCQMKIAAVEETEIEGEDGKKACASVLFVNEDTKEAVVAFRGTALYEWKDDFQGGARTSDPYDGVSTEYQRKALDWYQGLNLEEGGYDTITVTGHSKGGNKAKYITIMDPSVDRCVSFDGQGFSDEFFEEYQLEIGRNQWKISNHNVEYDYVNLLLNDVGEIFFYRGYDYGIGRLLEAHCPNTFFKFLNDGRVEMTPVEGQAEEMKILNDFLNSYLRTLPEERKVRAMNVTGGLVEILFKGEFKEKWFQVIWESEGGMLELDQLIRYTIKYACMHPEFTDAISSLGEKFYLEGLSEVIWYILKYDTKIKGFMSMPYMLRQSAAGIDNVMIGNSRDDLQVTSMYCPLEKNRVFDTNKMNQLGSTGKALMETGSHACEVWDEAVTDLKELCEFLPPEVQSYSLKLSLSAVSQPLVNDEYEMMGDALHDTLERMAEEIPMLDADAAAIIDEVTEKLSAGIGKIKGLEGSIGVSACVAAVASLS